jgi:hypothetical protein
MKTIIACEESQAVTKAFRNKGVDAYSNDIEECSGGHPEWHYQDDIMHLLPKIFININFLGAHPVCQFLANSGVRWLASRTKKEEFEWSDKYQIYINWERFGKMRLAALFFKSILSYVKSVGKGYVENPIMHKYAMEIIQEKPTQIIQPYQFGHMEKKATCLWVVGLPKLKETNNVYEEMMKLSYKDRAKVHYASPGPERAKLRSKTYLGIAEAIADQWSKCL